MEIHAVLPSGEAVTKVSAIDLGAPDAPITVDGLADIRRDGDWWVLDRLPPEESNYYVHPELRVTSRMPAGGVVTMLTDARGLRLAATTRTPTGWDGLPAPFDVLVDGALALRQTVDGRGDLVLDGLAGDLKRIDIWLPQFGDVRLGPLILDRARVVRPLPQGRRNWVAYGSSITQCRRAAGPSETWPALVARKYGYSLRGLGVSGQAHLDPDVARFIAAVPADVITLCLGINIYDNASFSARALGPAVRAFVKSVRTGHPSARMAVVTPIASPDREGVPNSVGLTLAEVREIIAGCVHDRQYPGDAITVVDGRQLLGVEDGHLLPDGLHPGPAGYRQIADRLIASRVLA